MTSRFMFRALVHARRSPDAPEAPDLDADREYLARVESLFHAAVIRPRAERSKWLRGLHPNEPALVADVLALVGADESAEDYGAVLSEPLGSLASLLAESGANDEVGDEASAAFDVGDRVGIYRIVQPLGRGGMGDVYLAEREDVGARVALKIVRGALAHDPRAEAQFLAERRALARLGHPQVARLLDAGVVDDGAAAGAPWVVMEYVDGEHIDVACDRRRLGVRDRLALFADVCDAVAAAHRQLVVHRDLKPSNVLVTEDGAPKLLDFGIAAMLDVDVGPGRLLTPQYAAPEQVRGEPAAMSVDVYALGLLLFELLTGRRPYTVRGTDRDMAARTVLHATIPRLSDIAIDGDDAATRAAARGTNPPALRRTLRGDLDAIVARALARDVAARYPSVAELAADVRRVLGHEPVVARGATGAQGVVYRTWRLVQRQRALVGAAAVMLVAVGVVTADALRAAQRAERERDRARIDAVSSARVRDALIGLFQSADPRSPATHPADRTPEALLHRGERVADALVTQPAAQADLLLAIGQAWSGMGDPAEAARVLRRAVDVRRSVVGPNDPSLADALDQLAQALGSADRMRAADSVIRQAVALRQAAAAVPTSPLERAEKHAVVASTDSVAELALARTLVRQGQLDFNRAQCPAAIPLYRQAAAIFARWPGGAISPTLRDSTSGPPADPATTGGGAAALWPALVSSDLGVCLDNTRSYDAADRAHRAALTTHEHYPSAYRLQYAVALNNYGVHLLAVGRDAEAESTHRRALAIKRALWPAEHPSTAASLVSLGAVLSRMGRFAAAESAYTEGVAMTKATLGPTHRRVPVALLGLGLVRLRRGDMAGAVEPFDEALRLARGNDPRRPMLVQRSAAGLGTALLALGRPAEAEPLLAEAAAIDSVSVPNVAPNVAPNIVPNTPNANSAPAEGGAEAREFSQAVVRARWATALQRLGRDSDAARVRRGERL